MLTVIEKPAQRRKFLSYDLEWIPGKLEVRICGVYDEIGGYRFYTTIDSFLECELTHKNRGRWFYAHAGGLADFQFILEKITKDSRYHCKCHFSGSSAIIAKVSRGKHRWYFVDSYWLLRDKLENIAKINHYHVQQLAYLLDRLSAVKEGDGTLLDSCMVMYGSGLADGNRHNHHALPIALFGRGGGTIAPGRHIQYPKDTPLTNLYLSMLDRMGASVKSIGDSTGKLTNLEG